MATINSNSDSVYIDMSESLELYDKKIINGRKEQFLYALCALDYEGLPVPLSRIELWLNGLVTGDVPTIEPQSRNEYFLKAILTGDTINLPVPQSRVEILLNKLANGDTDLSDCEPIQSRYEFLLSYLIKNGGIGGDIEYITYKIIDAFETLYTTAEKPVKSAILSGRTLVNLSITSDTTLSNGKELTMFNSMYKNNTLYTFIITTDKECEITYQFFNVSTAIVGHPITLAKGINKHTFTSPPTEFTRCILRNRSTDDVTFSNIMVIEGDYTNQDIPYFEGMQSVKMPVLTTTGKNLFDGKLKLGWITGSGVEQSSTTTKVTENFIPIQPGKYYACHEYNSTTNSSFNWRFFDKNKNFLSDGGYAKSIQVPNGAYYVKLANTCDGTLTNDVMFWETTKLINNSEVVEYEPFKSNILTVNEPIELRGVGDVSDTLDCLTGEVVQNIGEIVLDGSDDEKWGRADEGDTVDGFSIWKTISDRSMVAKGGGLCDKLRVSSSLETFDGQGILLSGDTNTAIVNITGATSVEDVKHWLSQNPITVQYQLAKNVIKTVDLTVVDQDNQPTQLGTFENVTHVSLVAENLIPEVEMEVATHISEELASASPLMDDISTEQEKLNTTIDEQSENVDATMIAVTEIFEEIL